MTRSIKEMEHTFDKHLTGTRMQVHTGILCSLLSPSSPGLKAVRKTILDVNSPGWHDTYSKFRTGVKELEVMVQNVINGIFVTVTTVQEGVEILEVFSHMATREVECSFSSGSSSTATLSPPILHYSLLFPQSP